MSGRRVVLLSAIALALFSALYSLAAWYDWWPRLPPGALHDSDLWAGFAGGVALLLVLLLELPLRHEEHNAGSRHRVVGEGLAPPAPPS
jgi:zinc transporter ZupT